MIGPQGENLIYLISPPRAGSTLLQRILAGHADVFATAEPWLMLHPLYALKNCGHAANYNAEWARAALSDFCENLESGEDAYVRAVAGMARELYNHALQPSGRRCFLDKTPRYYFIAPELLRTFPEAKFVFLLRHPLAVLSSILESWIGDDWPRLDHYACDLIEAPRLLAAALDRFGDRALVLRYEELVRAPEPVVRGLCERLGLTFDPQMLEYGGREKPKGRMGDDVGIQRHSRPVAESCDKWKTALADARRRYFAGAYLEALDAGVLARLGYPKDALLDEWRELPNDGEAIQPEWEAHAKEFLKPLMAGPTAAPPPGPSALERLETWAAQWPVAEEETRSLEATAVELSPAALGCLELAASFAERGEISSARDYIERAADLAPKHEGLRRLLARIRAATSDAAAHGLRRHDAALAAPSEVQPRSASSRCSQSGVVPPQSKEPAPLVSVIVSTYASEKFIRACLEDLEAQTIADRIEIIVIDSGSPENERAIVEEFQQRYANIRYVRTERETLYAAWNRGVQMARGQYVTNANSDDSHRPDAVELLVAALEANPDADLAYGDYITTRVPNDTFPPTAPIRHVQHPPYHPATLMFYCVTGCHPLWRRTVFEKIGLFDPAFTAPGDYEFMLRFVQHGLRAVRVPEPISLFYQNAEGLSFKSRERSEREFNSIQAAYRAEMPIERLFAVDANDPRSVALGWTALGNMAMACEVPWFDNASQDLHYAVTCYRHALRRDARCEAALVNLAIATSLQTPPGDIGRILQQLPAETAWRLKSQLAAGTAELMQTHLEPRSSRRKEAHSVYPPETSKAPVTDAPRTSLTADLAVRVSSAPVRWLGSFFDSSEEAVIARAIVPQLARLTRVGSLDFSKYDESVAAALPVAVCEALRETFAAYPLLRHGVTISHGPALEWQVTGDDAVRVGWTSFDPEQVSPRWAAACRQMDEVWLPSEAHVAALVRAGVPPSRLVVMPTPASAEDAPAVAEQVHQRAQELARGFGSAGVSPAGSPGVSPGAAMCGDAPPNLVAGNGCTTAVTSIAINWEGTFADLGSLSHVNRELTRELERQSGVQLQRTETERGTPMPHGSTTRVRGNGVPRSSISGNSLTVRHAWPPWFDRPASGALVMIQPWEFGALPLDWVRGFANVDELWVPSEYVRRVYLDSGIPAGKVRVLPNGIDPARFRPDAPPLPLPTRKTFKFLFVGGTIERKGADLLLETYLENFTANDDVCLVIKDFGGQGVYAGQTLAERIKRAQETPGAPEVVHFTDDLSPEQIAGLYTACDCLVHPYRGEGFALPVLEAMACGRPVIVTAGGATDDFATDEFAFRVPAWRRPIDGKVGGLTLAGRGWLLEPERDALAVRMRWVLAHRDEARARGRAASEHVRREWTWKKSARLAAQFAQELIERAPACPGLRRHDAALASPSESASGRISSSCSQSGVVPPQSTLAGAQALLDEKKFLEAWKAALAALNRRPFHPAAWLLLAEIAAAAGDAAKARTCAERARKLAPSWKPAKQFLARKLPGDARLDWPSWPEPSDPRLSVCLITKNEEDFLRRCLESVRGLATQIIVVDTGSTDRTVEIAREFGAEVHTFDWCDDFSAARNAALEHATGDWVLVLDADEELPAESAAKLWREIRRADVMAYRLPIVDAGRENEGCHYIPRLFRNAPGLFFTGRIHEQVFASLEPLREELGLENKLGTATILHHGYSAEVTASRAKNQRNLRLLKLALAEAPHDPNLWMNLGLELTRAGEPLAGLEAYDRAWLIVAQQPVAAVTPEFRETLLVQYVTQLIRGGCFHQVLQLFQTPPGQAANGNASLHFLRGMAALKLSRWTEAAEQMKRCLERRHAPSVTTVYPEIRTVAPRHCLAMALMRAQQPDAAARAFEAALAEAPDHFAVRFDYASFLFANGQDVAALEHLHQLTQAKPSDATVWQSGGKVALSRPEYLDVALDWTAAAVAQCPADSLIALQRAEALLLAGRSDEARPLWKRFHDPLEPRHVAALVICEVLAGEVRGGIALAGADAEVLAWFKRFAEIGNEAGIRALQENLERLRPRCPAAANHLADIFSTAAAA